MEKQIIENIGDLILEVYTIGYSTKGESQIIILREKSKSYVLLSFVIDCFSTKNKNLTLEILQKHKVATLDYFIWTHTDEDHSVGIKDLIKNFCTQKTNFILPEGVTGNEKDFIDYNEEIKESFSIINAFNVSQNYNVNTASVVLGYNQRIFYKTFKDYTSSLIFEVTAIAPISAIVRRRWEQKSFKNKNDISIATIFKVGELSLLFSGDIENQTINHIPEYYFDNLSFIKTPHHTSNSSNKLLDKIKDNKYKIPSATSTVFLENKLPNEVLIKEYLKYVEKFSSTGSGKNGFGYIKTTFDILKKEIEEEVFGDAIYHKL